MTQFHHILSPRQPTETCSRLRHTLIYYLRLKPPVLPLHLGKRRCVETRAGSPAGPQRRWHQGSGKTRSVSRAVAPPGTLTPDPTPGACALLVPNALQKIPMGPCRPHEEQRREEVGQQADAGVVLPGGGAQETGRGACGSRGSNPRLTLRLFIFPSEPEARPSRTESLPCRDASLGPVEGTLRGPM